MEIYLYDDKKLKQEILEIINDSSTDIDNFLSDAIDELNDISKEYNSKKKFIGVNAPLNESNVYCDEENLNNFCWYNFIPNDVKIVYGFKGTANHNIVNSGQYYYLNDNQYLKDFIKYIKGKEIYDDFDFISYVKEFLDYYFKSITNIDYKSRSDMHSVLIDSKGKYIKPLVEHSNRDFYRSNVAKCTEYSAMALNILGLFGYKALSIWGSVRINDDYSAHAYNVVNLDGENYLVDFASGVYTCNIDLSYEGSYPFCCKLDEDELQDLLNGKSITVDNYYIVYGENESYVMLTDTVREYIHSSYVISKNKEYKNTKK